MHPGLRRALHDGLAADIEDDWRPVPASAEERVRAYVEADIAAGRSTLTDIDEFDALTDR